MSNRRIVGIDPGMGGAIAVITECESPLSPAIEFHDVPLVHDGRRQQYNVPEMASLLMGLRFPPPMQTIGPVEEFRMPIQVGFELQVAIEKVGAMPGQGVTSMFRFGFGLGLWHGVLAALQIPYSEVTPQRWKKALLDGMPKEKQSSVLRALQLFPYVAPELKLKKHHGRADALLLAEYLRRQG